MKKLISKYNFNDVRGIQDLKKLCFVLHEREDYLIELAAQKDNYYDPYIDTKGKKPREIDRPIGDILKVQTKIRDRLLNLVQLCPIVFGAVEGKSTKDSSERHLKKDVVVKLDLVNCFHNSKARRVKQIFKKRFGFSEGVSNLLTELCTYRGYVPVGSTLSSTLVNLILNPLWIRIYEYAKEHNLSISVWIDDLSISGKMSEKHIDVIKKMINGYGYRISWSKKEIQRKNKAQTVNGGGVNARRVSVPKAVRIKIVESIKKDAGSDESMSKLAYAEFLNPNQAKQLRKLQKVLIEDAEETAEM